MATVRPSGHIGTGPLPQPCGPGLFLRPGWLGLVEELATWASSLRLAAVGQEAARAPTLQTVGHPMQAKAAEARVRWQGHGRDALALASVAEGQAHLPILPSDATVVGDGHTVGRAPERVEPRRRSGHRPLGRDQPRLVLEQVAAWPQALRGSKRRCVRSAHQGVPAGVEDREARTAAECAQSLHGQQAMRRGWHPAGLRAGQGVAWSQRVHGARGGARRSPGVSEPDATAWASQMVVAAREQRLAGGPHHQGAQRACVRADAGGEGMRHWKDAVAGGHRQACGCAVFAPLFLRARRARGTVAVAARGGGRALEATRPALCRMAPEFRGATDHEVVPACGVGGRHRVGSAVWRAREAQAGGDCPRWETVLCPACCGGAAPGARGHGRRPRREAAGSRPAPDHRGSGCWPGGGGPRAGSVWG